jgi:Zn-finger nucleic acid-binding protein
MQCPQCKGYQLEPRELEVGLIAAGCSKCKGIMLSMMNYRYWLDNNSTVKIEDIEVEISQNEEKIKICPKCSRLMTKYKIGSKPQRHVDLCSGCDDAWLDSGEWQLLKDLGLHNKLPSIFTEPWQKNIIRKKQSESIKAHYSQILGGADFGKVDVFKSWLDKHESKNDIKQYLITKLN